ncbi:MAG: glycine cleavage system protein GcvH [Fusobacteria bacterium]|nr:glycine cleavage system protein GcvH [Fusobacteriota bacterium]
MKNYNKSHEWIEIEGNVATVGISDFAQEHLGDIVFIDMPEVGDEFEANECFAIVDSVKATSDIYSPVAGKIIEVNEALSDRPELLNEDANHNWIVKFEFSNLDDSNFLSEEAYTLFCEQEGN